MSGSSGALGAGQMHETPLAFQCFDYITSIEFIERSEVVPNVRSAAYRPTEEGGQTRVRTGIQDELVDEDLTKDEAQAYIQGLVDAGMFAWDYSYRPAQGTFVNASHQWRLKVEFAEHPELGKCKPFIAEGENMFPDNYDEVADLLLRQA